MFSTKTGEFISNFLITGKFNIISFENVRKLKLNPVKMLENLST